MLNLQQQTEAYVLDIMAQIRSLHKKPDTYLRDCLKSVNEVHFITDSYSYKWDSYNQIN